MTSEQSHRTRTLWFVGILHAFTHVYQIAIVPLYLMIQRDFKLASEGQATLLLTLMGLIYVLPGYPMGVLADHFSRKKLLAIGLALNGLGFVLLGLSPNYGWAIFSVLLAGFGGSFYHPAATAMVARLFPVRTGKALGLAAIGASLGFFVGPVYAGWRAEMTGNWRTPVIELGALGIVFAGIFCWIAEEERESIHEKKQVIRTRHIFPTRTLWVFFLASCLLFSLRDFTGAAMGSLGSLFLQQAHGMNPKTTGFIISGIYLASAVSNPLFGRLSDKGRGRWTLLLLACATAMVAVFPRVPRGWMFPALMAYGFFFLATYPVVEAALMESVPDAVRGRIFGIFITVGGVVGNLSHWLAGVAVQAMGDKATSPESYYPVYEILAGLVAVSLLGVPFLHAIRKREEQAAPLFALPMED